MLAILNAYCHSDKNILSGECPGTHDHAGCRARAGAGRFVGAGDEPGG